MKKTALAVLAAFGICTLATAAEAPLKVAVYADSGPNGVGAIEWFRLVHESPDMELKLVNGADVRAGALDGQDVLVMPGGDSRREYATLGTNGAEKVKAFIRGGGGYIGTCAGCCLLMDEPNGRLNVIPFRSIGCTGLVNGYYDVNDKGAQALGVRPGPHKIRYNEGPILAPTTNIIDGASFEVWGTFGFEGAVKGKGKKGMYGAAALVGGTYGKGRVFVCVCHPEYFQSTLYFVVGAFKYVTGRDVTFPKRLRQKGAISVGFLCNSLSGVGMAKTILAIADAPDMDLVPIDATAVWRRGLDHIDVLVVPSEQRSKKGVVVRSDVQSFFDRGGKVVGFGKGVNSIPTGAASSAPGEEVVKTIRSLW